MLKTSEHSNTSVHVMGPRSGHFQGQKHFFSHEFAHGFQHLHSDVSEGPAITSPSAEEE